MESSETLRRAVPRQPADWFGYYRFDNVENEAWRRCRVLDISSLGAGIELMATAPSDRLDGLITVSFELRGKLRGSMRIADEATARVGVEFTDVSDAARTFIRSIDIAGPRW